MMVQGSKRVTTIITITYCCVYSYMEVSYKIKLNPSLVVQVKKKIAELVTFIVIMEECHENIE